MIDIIGGIRNLVARLTAARAGYLDNINNANLSTIADISTLTATEIARLDAAISTIATPAQVNTEVDNALDTAVPGAPTADSINERIKTIDDAGIPALVDSKVMGRAQIKEVSITSAANAGDVLVATITTQPCLIESIVIHADAAQTANMTSCGIFGGTGKVVTFIAAADALQADLDAADKQVAWQGAVRLAATKTIVISLVGTGAIAVDLTIVIKFRASVSGGYLA